MPLTISLGLLCSSFATPLRRRQLVLSSPDPSGHASETQPYALQGEPKVPLCSLAANSGVREAAMPRFGFVFARTDVYCLGREYLRVKSVYRGRSGSTFCEETSYARVWEKLLVFAESQQT